MNASGVFPKILVIGGGGAMLAGAIDPLEGCLLILAGSGMVTLGTFLRRPEPGQLADWIWIFTLIAVGVAAMIGLSAAGGIGGSSGRSEWWAITMLPYPVGWVLGMVSLSTRLIKGIRFRHPA